MLTKKVPFTLTRAKSPSLRLKVPVCGSMGAETALPVVTAHEELPPPGRS